MQQRMAYCAMMTGLFAGGLVLTGCTSTGHINILGYTTEPNYDPAIHTVFVSIAKNVTLKRGSEEYLTRAVIREINLKTPFRTVSCREQADTELCLKIVSWRKNLVIPTPDNLIRQAETGFGVEVVWKDLRPDRVGDILSNRKPALPGEPPLPGMDNPPPDTAVPVLLLPSVTYEPELGPSNATAEQQALDRLAVQIVSMMEKSW
jgi:hypothetical protein